MRNELKFRLPSGKNLSLPDPKDSGRQIGTPTWLKPVSAILLLLVSVMMLGSSECNNKKLKVKGTAAGSSAYDTTAPSVPTGLNASGVSPSRINLTWTASTDDVGVAGYNIYRNGSPVGASLTTSYSDTGLSLLTTYTYTVVAYGGWGNISAQSSPASATTTAAPAMDDYVWVTNAASDNITRIKKSDSSMTTIAVGDSPYGVAVDETYCWVANAASDNITRIKKSDLSTTTITAGTDPVGVAVDETYLWVVNYTSNNVTCIKKSDLSKTTISVGAFPLKVGVDGTYCWVANFGFMGNGNTVTRIQKSNSATTTITVGDGPRTPDTGYAYDNIPP